MSAPSRWYLAIATAACTGLVLYSPKSAPPAIVVMLILLATAGSIELSRREARAPGDPRPIVTAIAALFAFAVLRPTRFATDIWSYAIIGRTVSVHHLNPYRIAPAAIGTDPLVHWVHASWRTVTTPYSPFFVVHAGLVALVSGSHPLAYRLAYQLIAAAAIGIALWLLWRETHSTAALALVGLNPEIAGSIVNAGHNDALIALGLLGVVLLLKQARFSAAGWVLCAAVLVKVSIGFAVLPLALWTVTRSGKRGLVSFLAPTVLVAAPITLLVPGALHSISSANEGIVTRLSIWNVPQRFPLLGLSHQPGVNFVATGLLVALAISCLGAVVGRDQPDAGRGAAVGVAGWLVGAAYVLAWYAALGLLVAALHPTDRLARWFAVQGGVITAAFLIPRASLPALPVVGYIAWFLVPAALAAGLAWALVPLIAEAARLRQPSAPRADATPSERQIIW